MENIKLVNKLKNRANVSYEVAKSALENNNWDILDAVVYLEKLGLTEKPLISMYYTNEEINKDEINEFEKEDREHTKNKTDFTGFFESVCRVIDTYNNIFFEIKKEGRVLLKIPITLLIVCLFFGFWLIVPLAIVGLFFDFEYSIEYKSANREFIDKINKLFKEIAKNVRLIKEKIKKEV